ncbi:reverse transcriptase domain-containing protein [Tanacetum coccineum]
MITLSQSSIVKPIDAVCTYFLYFSTLSRYKDRLVANGSSHQLGVDFDETIQRVRLVVNDSSQQLGVDFDETFSLFVKPATICTVLNLVVSQIFIWTEIIISCLISAGSQVAYLLIYVDGIILTASCPVLLQQIIGTSFGFHPFQFSCPPRKLTMEDVKQVITSVTTRGGKTTTEIIHDTNDINKEPMILHHDKPIEPNEVLIETKPHETKEQPIQLPTPLIPFPHWLKKEKEEAQQQKFLKNPKQLHINTPFTKALSQMPKYAKFLKGLLSNKTRLEEAYTVIMNERCSAVLLNKLPSKEKDPRSFTIPCDIGHLHINNVLVDLGSSISLMPYMIYKKLGFFQIPIVPEDQEKTTFTCSYGTFSYRRMPFGLCNALATFQRSMTAIFHDMVEDLMKVFMDDFSVFGNSFDQFLNNLDKMLGKCEETNLVLNWEKCHFMVKKGIVLGHKISGKGIEVDKAKINVIAKLPYPSNVKGVRSFLGHGGFYRRFIKDFSIETTPIIQLYARPKFDFSEDLGVEWISKKRTKIKAKRTKPSTEWKEREKSKSKST